MFHFNRDSLSGCTACSSISCGIVVEGKPMVAQSSPQELRQHRNHLCRWGPWCLQQGSGDQHRWLAFAPHVVPLRLFPMFPSSLFHHLLVLATACALPGRAGEAFGGLLHGLLQRHVAWDLGRWPRGLVLCRDGPWLPSAWRSPGALVICGWGNHGEPPFLMVNYGKITIFNGKLWENHHF